MQTRKYFFCRLKGGARTAGWVGPGFPGWGQCSTGFRGFWLVIGLIWVIGVYRWGGVSFGGGWGYQMLIRCCFPFFGTHAIGPLLVKWSECEGDCVLGLSVCARAWALFLYLCTFIILYSHVVFYLILY